MQDKDDSPWDDAPSSSTTHAETEWTRLSSAFQNVRPPSPLCPDPGLIANQPQAGYRDGITAGKESALQQGFDAGFAQAGAPRGRELGILRGIASALLLHLSRAQAQAQAQTHPQSQTAIEEEEQKQAKPKAKAATATAMPAVREIVDALAAVRFADIAPAPPPDEAEHTHCAADEAKYEEEEEGGAAAAAEEGEQAREGEEEEAARPRRRSRSSSTGLGLGPSAGSTTTTIEDVRALRVRLEALLRESGLNVVDLNLESPAS